MTSQILTIRRILEGVQAKNLQVTLLFVNFTKAFDSIHRGKMEQILLVYGLPKETMAAITILYRNTKVKVRSPDRDTEYFNIVAGVLQGDMLAPYLFIICLDYVLRTSIDKIRENGFELTKKRRHPAKTITEADYIAMLANTPNQAETLLHSLEWTTAGIGLHVNAHKTEDMCYNQTGDITTLDFKKWRCPWCSRYRRRKWTRRHEFKSWMRLIAFHIALIPLGKIRIQLFSLQLWVNSRTD